jgi:hypothetical protein
MTDTLTISREMILAALKAEDEYERHPPGGRDHYLRMEAALQAAFAAAYYTVREAILASDETREALRNDELKALTIARERGFTDRDILRRGLEALGFLP